MQRDEIAEWILCQVAGRERAVSIVGDTTELADTRGNLWFWSGVLRTVSSMLWQGLAVEPLRMIGLACLAWLRVALFPFVIIAVADVGAWVAVAFALLTGYQLPVLSPAGFSRVGTAVGFCFSGPFLALYAFRTGRWIARKVPGRELSAALALFALSLVMILFFRLTAAMLLELFHLSSDVHVQAVGGLRDLAWVASNWVATCLAPIAGALCQRRRTTTLATSNISEKLE